MKVFISHSSNDSKFTRLLKSCLTENDILTWFDEDELNFGDSLLSKLEKALDESSHFVIVLSKASVSSDWVQLELKRAIKHKKSGLVDKIIPIKYRECELPEEMKELLHADLTKEIVLPDGDKVKFISDGFDRFFLRLVRALRDPSKSLNKTEKHEIKKSLLKETNLETKEDLPGVIRGIYQVEGPNTTQDVVYLNKINNSKYLTEDKNDIRPILLPELLKAKWNLKLGELLTIVGPDFISTSHAHFAGFRNDDLKIVANVKIRGSVHVFLGTYYNVEFDILSNRISFVEEIKKG